MAGALVCVGVAVRATVGTFATTGAVGVATVTVELTGITGDSVGTTKMLVAGGGVVVMMTVMT